MENPQKLMARQMSTVILDTFSPSVDADKVYLENGWHKEIFNRNMKENYYLPWKRGIVKITRVNENGKFAIHRMFHGGNAAGINRNMIGLSGLNMSMLALKDGEESALVLEKGSKFLFYWDHPNHQYRIAFKLGFTSVLLGGISLLRDILRYYFS